jgi:uncharacterized protein (DUF433 family)
MDRSTRGFDGEALADRPSSETRSNPRPPRAKRDRRSGDFALFAESIVRELNPRGPLETVMADHVALSAWRLSRVVARQKGRADGTDPEPQAKRAIPTVADRAARSVREALETWDFLRQRSSSRPVVIPVPEIPARQTREAEPNELEVDVDWRTRLVLDPEISDVSPVVKGTWVSVGHVVSLVVDGWTWADILRAHPELTEEDVRACLAYTIHEEELSS